MTFLSSIFRKAGKSLRQLCKDCPSLLDHRLSPMAIFGIPKTHCTYMAENSQIVPSSHRRRSACGHMTFHLHHGRSSPTQSPLLVMLRMAVTNRYNAQQKERASQSPVLDAATISEVILMGTQRPGGRNQLPAYILHPF